MCLVVSLEHVLAMAMFVRALHDDMLCASLVFVLRLPQSFVTHIVKHLRYICRVAASKHTVAFLTHLSVLCSAIPRCVVCGCCTHLQAPAQCDHTAPKSSPRLGIFVRLIDRDGNQAVLHLPDSKSEGRMTNYQQSKRYCQRKDIDLEPRDGQTTQDPRYSSITFILVVFW